MARLASKSHAHYNFLDSTAEGTKLARKPKIARKSPNELLQAHQFRVRVVESIETLGKHALWAAGMVLFGYVAIYLPVEVSRGQETTINYVTSFIGDVKLNVGLAWGTTFVAALAYWRERRLRLTERRDKDERIEKLEKQIDPDRTSSNLSVSGTKARKDRV